MQQTTREFSARFRPSVADVDPRRRGDKEALQLVNHRQELGSENPIEGETDEERDGAVDETYVD